MLEVHRTHRAKIRNQQQVEDSANSVSGLIMDGYGFVKDIFGKFNLPIPANPITVTPSGFTIEVPNEGMLLHYIAIGI